MVELSEPNRTDMVVKLADGRALGYAEYGDPMGKPVFHFHGTPSSRLEAARGHEVAVSQGIRLIGIDRPGMGLSDFQRGRSLLDWPDDVSALGEALEVDEFAVVGVSGGGAYAAACAYKIPERLSACGIVSGIGPPDIKVEGVPQASQVVFSLARRAPWLLSPLLWWVLGRHMQDRDKAEGMLLEGAEHRPEPDRRILESPEFMDLYYAETVEAFRQKAGGVTRDFRLYTMPWGFQLEDIRCGRVYLWHGVLDESAPVAMGKAIADKIPDCRAIFYEEEGHLSVGINRLDEVLKALAS